VSLVNLAQKPHASTSTYYATRIQEIVESEALLMRQDRYLTHLRLILFVISAGCLTMGVLSDDSNLWFGGAGLSFLAFVFAIAIHDRVTEHLERDRERRRLLEENVARIQRDWSNLPLPAVSVPADHAAVATDLDLFGRASLFQLLCTAHTRMGIEVLRDWLLTRAAPDVLRGRNEAVTELANQQPFREAVNLEARLLARSRSGPHRFVQWAESEPWLACRPGLKWASRVLPTLLVVFLLLTFWEIVPRSVGGSILCLVLIANVTLSIFFAGSVHDIYVSISTQDQEERRYRRLFALMSEMPDRGLALQSVKLRTAEQGGGALRGFRALGRIVWLTNTNLSSLKFVVHVCLQTAFLWDFHVLALLEWWQRHYGPHARVWFEALGELEALISLAQLRHDCPHWTFAKIDEQADCLSARGLGHALLRDDVCVVNDVEVGPPGSFLLVTGSNMSGKSTLLRAIGLNVILAHAGAPVCACHLELPPVTLETSMRIRDSLEDGVSFYMAELQRLKQVVDRADQMASVENDRLLYLLDEILLGTNSRERHIAVVRVISHLLQCRAIGAISTHDLELAGAPLDNACRTVHFRETLHDEPGQPPMTFDYRLRPGIATTSNALKLLEIVGLD
jgi:hypothetical protein